MGREPLHHFVSRTDNRSLQRCASCCESDATLRAKKKLAERSLSSSLKSNIVDGPLEQPFLCSFDSVVTHLSVIGAPPHNYFLIF